MIDCNGYFKHIKSDMSREEMNLVTPHGAQVSPESPVYLIGRDSDGMTVSPTRFSVEEGMLRIAPGSPGQVADGYPLVDLTPGTVLGGTAPVVVARVNQDAGTVGLKFGEDRDLYREISSDNMTYLLRGRDTGL